MSETIITVEKLSKRYTIQHRSNRREGFRHLVEAKLTAPFRKLFGRNGSENDSINVEASEEFWALKDVSFEVKRGEVVGIIGRNGAGKSTLLKILSRITEPTEGSIRLRGRVASLLEVGTGFHPELTGRENIFLNGAILGMSKAEIKRKFDEIVAFSEVEKFLDTPVKRYSSGMYVRLAFAVAAHLEPEILIVDEVLAVGDAEFQKKCLGKMERASRSEGKTVLLVSHTMPLIKQLASRAIILKQGELKASGNPEKIVAEYMADAEHATVSGPYSTPRSAVKPAFSIVDVKTSDDGYIHRMGEPLDVSFEISCPQRNDNLWLSFKILAKDGKAVCFACFIDPKEKRSHHRLGSLAAGIHRFKCRLSAFPGYMGDYSIEAIIFDESKGKVIDLVENICPFSVYIPSDFVLGGDWRQDLCSFLVPFEWEIN